MNGTHPGDDGHDRHDRHHDDVTNCLAHPPQMGISISPLAGAFPVRFTKPDSNNVFNRFPKLIVTAWHLIPDTFDIVS